MKTETARGRSVSGTLGALLALFLVAAGAGAQEDLYERSVVLPVPEDARVEVERDLIYKRADGEDLLMDVYRPQERSPDTRLPAVVFVHGGPVPGPLKDAAQFTSYGRLVAASGLAAVTFSHRFTAPAELPTAATDVDEAFAYLREHATELSIDPDRICVWAFSFGGVFVTPMLRERPEALRCAVLYYALVDPATATELGMEGIPVDFAAEYDATEAVAATGDPLPRIVVARAGTDFAPLNQALDEFVTTALDANAPLDLMNHSRGEHVFDVLDDDERSRSIIRRTLEIVEEVLSTDGP